MTTLSSLAITAPPFADIELDDNFQIKLKHATQLILWAINNFGENLIMSTSFGIQSAVLLHLTTSVRSNIPTVWIDTGYLPSETYVYALQLKELMSINLKIYQAEMSPAHMEAIHGRLWESSNPEERRLYGLLRKVLPMKKAQKELNAKCVLIGLRKQQTDHRNQLQQFQFIKEEDSCKLYPLLNWTNDDIQQYFEMFQLPPHPLSLQGFTTVGDSHSSRPKSIHDKNDRMTRFGGSGQQECGLHTEKGSLDFLQSISHSTSQKTIESHLASSPLSVMMFPSDNSLSSSSSCSSSLQDTPMEYTIYTRPSCKYCQAAKALMKQKGFIYHEIEVLIDSFSNEFNSQQISSEELTHLIQKIRNDSNFSVLTVPQIVINNQQHIGGFTDLCASLSLSEHEKDQYLKEVS